MRARSLPLLSVLFGLALGLSTSQAATLTVTTADNANPPAGATSLLQALTSVQEGDTIVFDIPGDGPHYLETPSDGYPLITVNDVTIDGYSQSGAVPNTNPILAANNAQLKIVLDSRNGNSRVMDFEPDGPQDDTGYGDGESAILGILEATGVTIRGLSLLGTPTAGGSSDVALYGISLAKGASAKIQGCWIGVDPDGETIAGPVDGITGFRYRVRDDSGTTVESILIQDLVVGVEEAAEDAPAQFNVITGIPAIPIIVEGKNNRFSGNFIEVFPDGVRDFNPALDPELAGMFEGAIEIGRAGDNTLIGVDGDGVNDANERNILGGVLPPVEGGYDHTIEFYGQTPGTNIVIAGNYIGIGINATRFTNGVPALNAAGGSAQYRFGSNLDGVSDDLEGNLVYNYWPADFFVPEDFWFDYYPSNLNFFDELSATGIVSARGNTFVNNFPFPLSITKENSPTLADYYAQALVNVGNGVLPTLSDTTTSERLIGSVPLADTDNWPQTIVDLYAVDPEGIATGIAALIDELPDGFVQGKNYMASFVVDGPDDLDPAPGAFEFDISTVEKTGNLLTITANYAQAADDPDAVTLTSPFSDPPVALPEREPGLPPESMLPYIVEDTPVINPGEGALGNWEPYASVMGESTFLIEGNTFAEDSLSEQRYVVALQPVDGGQATLGEGFYADDGSPFLGPINASRQNGNPGRVAGDKRPGATTFMVGGEASPHVWDEFLSDGRWDLGFDRLADGRYGTVQTYSLDPTTLTQTPLSKALDSANGRLTEGFPPGNQITRFGGDIACLDNGNYVSVVEDRSQTRSTSTCAAATIFAPDGAVVTETFVVANGDIWSNVAAHQGGFAVRVAGVLYFFDNDGNALGEIDQNSSGASFDRGRGDGTRIGAHIASPYVFLVGKVTDAPQVKIAAWDARDRSPAGLANVSEGDFTGGFDRANLGVDALNRITVGWVSQPEGYEAQQVAGRVLAYDGATRSFTPLTPSFLFFVNQAKTGGIHTSQMSVAMTTRQILMAAKGEINLENEPENGADSPAEINFYAVLHHPDPKDLPSDATKITDVGLAGGQLTLTWEGGAAPYTVQTKASLSETAWTDVLTTSETTATVAVEGSAAFYRVVSQ